MAAATAACQEKAGRQVEKPDRWLAHARANENEGISWVWLGAEGGEAVDVDSGLHEQGQTTSGRLEAVYPPALSCPCPGGHFPQKNKTKFRKW